MIKKFLEIFVGAYIDFKLNVFFYLGRSLGFDQVTVEPNDDGEVVSIKLTNTKPKKILQ
jgi:hypothetical protein